MLGGVEIFEFIGFDQMDKYKFDGSFGRFVRCFSETEYALSIFMEAVPIPKGD